MQSPIPVIAIFDIGKTNKKVFLFNEEYQLVYEKTTQFNETTDEDGFPCDSLQLISNWMVHEMDELTNNPQFIIRAVNCTAYGASFVYLNEEGNPLTPLYNYLKPYPPSLLTQFYARFGSAAQFSLETASPALGSLNSGLQVYRLKNEQSSVYNNTRYALHLPQYLSYILTKNAVSELTSIGCHTGLWNFATQQYHPWVIDEAIAEKFPPIRQSNTTQAIEVQGKRIQAGIGLHDSSSALIPYLISVKEPFILVSTGTWNISLNPFNHTPLTVSELQNDCLFFNSFKGTPVKAARLFMGHEFAMHTKRIAAHFNIDHSILLQMPANHQLIVELLNKNMLDDLPHHIHHQDLVQSVFGLRSLNNFADAATAFHQLMIDLVKLQQWSIELIVGDSAPKQLFVDGGFSNNQLFMQILANLFPQMQVYAALVPQATALGAALAIHQQWNSKPIPHNLIKLTLYTSE